MHVVARSTLLTSLRTVPGQNAPLPFDRLAYQSWASSLPCSASEARGPGSDFALLLAALSKRTFEDVLSNMKVGCLVLQSPFLQNPQYRACSRRAD